MAQAAVLFRGLVIDGPALGRNIEAWSPRVSVPLQRFPALRPEGPPLAPDDVRFNTVEYEFAGGVWACGEYLRAWDDWVPDAGQVDGAAARTGPGRGTRIHNGRRMTS